jgi:meckelin
MEENELLLTANRIKSKVSVWRTLLVANEFNELSTVRTVSVEWTLILVGFVLIGLGF